jgi:hypothetical protein
MITIISALKLQPELERAAYLIHEIVQEKIPKLELLAAIVHRSLLSKIQTAWTELDLRPQDPGC